MKKYIIPALIVIGIVILVLTLRNSTRIDGSFSAYNVLSRLIKAGYSSAEVVEKPILPDTLADIADIVKESVTAEGTWSPDTVITPDDTLAVEVSVIEIENMKFVRVEIEGKPVHLEKIRWFEEEEELGRWSAGVETAILREFDLGLFISYKLGEIADVRTSVAGVVDLNQKPEWVAAEIQGVIQLWRSIEIGGGLGAMLEQNDIDFHASFVAGIRF